MKAPIFIAVFATQVFLSSCSSNSKEKAIAREVVVEETHIMEPPPLRETVQYTPPVIIADEESWEYPIGVSTFEKKIIKDGDMRIETTDVNRSKKIIDDLLKTFNAYYEKEDLENNEHAIAYDLTIRIPSDNFEQLLSGIEKGNGEIKDKNIRARDVTEEYVDLETRLISKRALLKRYMELLSKAKNVKEMLEVEENIGTLQEEIESKEGRLKYLKDQVAFSTLEINLYKTKEPVQKATFQLTFTQRVKKSLSRGWTSVVNHTLIAIGYWPAILLSLAALFLLRRVFMLRKKRRSSPSAA